MFSGLIGRRGRVERLDILPGGGATLWVRCEGVVDERPNVKDSIAINGVCLTATHIQGEAIAFDVIPETLHRSTLAGLVEGDSVNVEYSLRVGERIGGHFVYGHIDIHSGVIARIPEGQGERIRIELPTEFTPYIIEKGYVAVDGVSLTVAATGDGWFELALIPETLARTTLGDRAVGSAVNLEIDPVARYAVTAMRSMQ